MVEKDVEVCGASLRGRFESKALSELYRQFLVEAFSSGDDEEKNSKLFMSLDRLKLVLGLEDDEVPFRHRYVHRYTCAI